MKNWQIGWESEISYKNNLRKTRNSIKSSGFQAYCVLLVAQEKNGNDQEGWTLNQISDEKRDKHESR